MTITYFVHGTTTDNEQGIASGWADAELSSLGIAQADALREQTQHRQFDMVFSSDLRRAVDTAHRAFGGRFPLKTDERLRECNYGTFSGKPVAQMRAYQPTAITTPFPGGESYRDVAERIASFLALLKKEYAGKRVAIVAHQAPQLALDVLCKGMTWEQAFAADWRNTKQWQPGWEYTLEI